jgi:WD40 repeat protein/energy-coupling factor transporter ATP-binding protein EcfA2
MTTIKRIHFAYPNVKLTLGKFIGCGRYLASEENPGEGYELAAPKITKTITKVRMAASILSPESCDITRDIYEIKDDSRAKYAGDSQALAYLLALISRSRDIKIPLGPPLEKGEGNSDIWCTGAVDIADGKRPFLDAVDFDGFNIKLNAFLFEQENDRLFIVPAPIIQPAHESLFKAHDVRVISLTQDSALLPDELSQRKTVLLVPPFSLDVLLDGVFEKPEEKTLPLGPNPYKGLEAFREQDAQYFFGRRDVIQTLQEAVQKHPFTAVIGASGSGKSSLVFAGLVPLLKETGEWLIADFRPRNQPFYELAQSLIPLLYKDKLEQGGKLKEFTEKLESGGIDLSYIAKLIIQEHQGKRLLLIADQFEELWTLNPINGKDKSKDLQNRFVDRLVQALSANDLKIVLTIRADFMGQAVSYGPFAELLNSSPTEILAPMTEKELRDAIERPAEKSGVKLEPGLADLILSELKDEPGNLPLLEFALTQLWDRQHSGKLTHDAYKAVGGVNEALARHADAVYREFSHEEREQLRQVFVQLVHPGEGTEDTRQVATRDQVRPENWNLIAKLANRRLVVTRRSEETEQEIVEVVHEALIRHWHPLQKWMKEERGFRIWQERLRVGMRQWEASKYDEGALLRGAPLAEAENWFKERRYILSEDDQKFIEAALQLRDREIAEREKQVQTRRRFLQGVCVIILISALIVFFLWRQADTQREIALSRQLAAQSMSRMDSQFETSLLLSVEACNKANTFESFDALLKGLQRHPYISSFMQGDEADFRSVAFSPDGKILASGSKDKAVILWDVEKRKQIGKLGRQEVFDVAFSPDGKILVSAGSSDGNILLWNTETQKRVGKLKGHKEAVFSVAFSLDGKMLASGSSDKTIILWDIENQRQIVSLTGKGTVFSVAFDSNGKILASGNAYDTLILWDVEKRKKIKEFSGHKGAVKSVAFSPDGKMLASGGDDGVVILWDIEAQNSIESFREHNKSVLSVSFSSDGEILASGSSDNTIILWDTKNKSQLERLVAHNGYVWDVAFGSSFNLLASGSADKSIILWDMKKQQSIAQSLEVCDEAVLTVAFGSDNKTMASGVGNDIKLWDIKTSESVELKLHSASVLSVAFSPDGKKLASGSVDNAIILWDLKTKEPKPIGGKALTSHKGAVMSVSFSPPDGKILASGSADNSIILWDVESQEKIATFPVHHNDSVLSVTFSPDGKILASGSKDKKIILWDVEKEKPIGHPFNHNDAVSSVSFGPDGKILASGTHGREIILWNVKKQEPVGEFPRLHNNSVLSIIFSPDGKFLVSGSTDNSIILWDVEKREPIGEPFSHKDDVSSVSFSPNGKTIVSGSYDKFIKLWDVSIESWKEKACYITNRNFTQQEWKKFVGDESYRQTCPDCP